MRPERAVFLPFSVTDRRGFSLVEILVATTLLLIITVVISMVFQQAGGAWAAGSGRAKAEEAVRAVVGSIERDLLSAIDARDYGIPNPKGSGSSLTFVALQHLYNHRELKKSGRAPCLINYRFSSGAVIRYMSPLQYNGSPYWGEDSSSPYNTEATVNGGIPLSGFQFECVPRDDDPLGLPLRVEIAAEAKHSSSFFTINARSAGPNRKFDDWDAKKTDDIRVGGRL
ncbi:MAG: prepilin-type N-terminal cleavage/methylation domain-containing protein [Lentisphaerae bacterium]|nr:prepilin-type N-terminal cleavage/methylation domain-containing protein [Lentisphaerota bacterium]